ncbi:inositol polyphosphate-5-phosphatase A-like isoform X2 [Daktulosphaira vitifoliae]|nr:inositol polyphosphate-5-phosphatase A-like isoform X2 [Daktulosphaira vitifoliae]
MLKTWTEEFLNTVTRLDPYFIALHCQEVGGKNYEESMKHVKFFVSLLMNSKELRIFNRAQVFLDEEFTSAENFTALGNMYFIHKSINDVLLWDFKDLQFIPITETNVYSGSIEDVSTKEKSKFPQEFFPECKWSRKGFLRTRWKLNGSTFDLVNIHLFHDASNFTAMESHPSVYSIMRQKALEYTLERFREYEFGYVPFFLFGDFNFRTDTKAVIMKLVKGLDLVKDNLASDNLTLQYADSSNEVVLKLGKKEFCHLDHQNTFVSKTGSWLKDFDHELKPFKDQIFEFPIKFQPSYPFEENEQEGKNYMKTRCPAWCDRVVLSTEAKSLLDKKVFDEESCEFEYDLIGKYTCMGDHKPVYLKLDIMNNAGTVLQCECKLYCVTPKTSNCSLHALLGVDIDKCDPLKSLDCKSSMIALSETSKSFASTPPLTTLSPMTLVTSSSTTSTPQNINSHRIVITDVDKDDETSSPNTSPSFSCGNFLRKKIGDIYQENKTVSSSWSNCVCKTNKWKLPILVHKAWRQNGQRRVRLKSNASLNMPLQRYQSHHSSSDEDWFEEIAEDEINSEKSEKDNNSISNISSYKENYADPMSNQYSIEKSQIEENSIETTDDCSKATTSSNVSKKFKWSSFRLRKICEKSQPLNTFPVRTQKVHKVKSKNSCKII